MCKIRKHPARVALLTLGQNFAVESLAPSDNK